MAGEPRSQLQFHRSTRRDFEDYESLTRLVQSHLLQTSFSENFPLDIDGFAGRQGKVDDAIALLEQAKLPGHHSPIVLAIGGRAGVGKSTLAIHVAHQVRSTFTDVQLYMDLRGNDHQPLPPTEVLAHFLRICGTSDADMPATQEERSRLLNLFLAGKQSLILLDNAEDEKQVRSLIPTAGLCVVLITSRNRLINLPGVVLMDLAEMSEIAALELLQRVALADISQPPGVGMAVVNLCSRLPLALCTFGNLLQRQPHLLLQEAVEQLADQRKRLKALHLSHVDIRATFNLSYQQLDPTAALLLRRLGLLMEICFTVPLAAILLESEPEVARAAIQQLVEARLLKSVGGRRFRLTHDLIRLLVRGQLAVEESSEARLAARLRLCQWYLQTANLMSLALKAPVRTKIVGIMSRSSRQLPTLLEQKVASSTIGWFEAERLNLQAAIEWAHQAESWQLVIALAEAVVRFYDIRMYWQDWEKTHRLALDAARRLEDQTGEAAILNNLGNAYARQQQWEKAQDYYQRSLSLFAVLQEAVSEAQTLVNLGILYAQQQPEKTIAFWHMALTKLPTELPEHKRLKQWMQTIDKTLAQQAIYYDNDRPARGLFESIGKVLRRFVVEE